MATSTKTKTEINSLKTRATRAISLGPVLAAILQLIEDAAASGPAIWADIEALLAAFETPPTPTPTPTPTPSGS